MKWGLGSASINLRLKLTATQASIETQYLENDQSKERTELIFSYHLMKIEQVDEAEYLRAEKRPNPME